MSTEKVRIDKWLWSVRVFKSRSMATDACKKGHIKIRDKVVKPSYLLKRGEYLEVRRNGFNLTFEVIDLISKRVSSPLAVVCYVNHTPDSEMNKYKDWYIGKGGPELREKGSGRPTKRQRREIDEYKEVQFWDDDPD